MPPSATEQYLLELINRARLDPAAEAARIGIDLNRDLAGADRIEAGPKQVLAPNGMLGAAARDHSQWMLAGDTFSHSGAGGSDPGDRIEAAGYALTGSWTWGENLALTSFGFGDTADDRLGRSYLEHHTSLDPAYPMQLGIGKNYVDLFFSEHHRTNTLGDAFREIGLGQVRGDYQGFDVSMLTEDFASSGPQIFITGVAYGDADRDAFYSIGEGRGGAWIESGGARTTTADAGGYALAVDPGDAVRVTVGIGADPIAALTLDPGGQNAKLDLVEEAGGGWRLDLSASARLDSGAGHLRLLGAGDLDLTAGRFAQHLEGNAGNNDLRAGPGRDTVEGGAGNDRLWGHGGHDTLYGGDGFDLLRGNFNNDTLHGGGQRDRMWGGMGNDRLDGDDGNDTLRGGEGSDILFGGQGRDRLDGGPGNDILTGGSGADTFVFNGGDDRITDFGDGSDTVLLLLDRLTLTPEMQRATADIGSFLALAETQGGDLVFDLGSGNRLTFEGLSNVGPLYDHLMLA